MEQAVCLASAVERGLPSRSVSWWVKLTERSAHEFTQLLSLAQGPSATFLNPTTSAALGFFGNVSRPGAEGKTEWYQGVQTSSKHSQRIPAYGAAGQEWYWILSLALVTRLSPLWILNPPKGSQVWLVLFTWFSVRKKAQWWTCDSWKLIRVTQQHWKLWATQRQPSPVWSKGSCSLFRSSDVYETGIHTTTLSFPLFSNSASFSS